MLEMRRILLTVTALLCLPMQSCCSLARLFCGPDKSEWVSVRFDTPELAVRTFLEALRRDDPSVVYKCLSEPFRAELGIDQDTAVVIWPKLRDRYPGLHVAGYAEVPDAKRVGANAAVVDLEIEGQPFQVELIRQCQWQVRFRREGLTGPKAIGEFGKQAGNAADLLNVTPIMDDPPMSMVSLNGRRVIHYGVEELSADSIESIVLEHTWRINGFPPLDE